jgi:hypothetical protein
MAFLRRETASCKKEILEQVKDFEYLGCETSYENEEMY